MGKYIGIIGLLVVLVVLIGCGTLSKSEAVMDRSEYNWQLVWSDEFDSEQIDSNKWNFVTGAGGYGNNELQYYSGRHKNGRVENGNLIIEAHKESFEGSDYTSAKMTTEEKGDWTYGRYEIRAKLPEGQGIWPAFWMMPSDYSIYGTWPSCGEIDIMELLGHETNRTYGTLHYGNPHKYTGDSFTLDQGSFSDSFHTFAIDWFPGEIRWYIDGHLFQTQNDWYSKTDIKGSGVEFPAPFDRDFYMQFNLAVGGNWPGYPDATTNFPQKLVVDWIRVYESADGYPELIADTLAKENGAEPGREPLEDGNYVFNGNFDNDMDNWVFENHEGGSGAVSVIDEQLVIAMNAPGEQVWANQLYQTDMNIRRGNTYKISFSAKAEKDRSIRVKIGGLADRGWSAYSEEISVDITTMMKDYNYTFTMVEKTDTKARFEFNMGLDDSDITLDNIKLIQVN